MPPSSSNLHFIFLPQISISPKSLSNFNKERLNSVKVGLLRLCCLRTTPPLSSLLRFTSFVLVSPTPSSLSPAAGNSDSSTQLTR
ncbi:hypothetical protein HanIR_Chr12g0568781 [Helianthus annuus]|nr:hypothetical protein HanIR_Chr12g0568781 [Helianthus annuus]